MVKLAPVLEPAGLMTVGLGTARRTAGAEGHVQTSAAAPARHPRPAGAAITPATVLTCRHRDGGVGVRGAHAIDGGCHDGQRIVARRQRLKRGTRIRRSRQGCAGHCRRGALQGGLVRDADGNVAGLDATAGQRRAQPGHGRPGQWQQRHERVPPLPAMATLLRRAHSVAPTSATPMQHPHVPEALQLHLSRAGCHRGAQGSQWCTHHPAAS